MIDIQTLQTDYGYTSEHEWTSLPKDQVVGQKVKVGITNVATTALGDIVYLDLPQVGAEVTAGEVCGEIESTKSVAELFSPVSGTVTAVNEDAVNDPAKVNEQPFGDGWLFEVAATAAGDIMDAQTYAQTAEG